MAKFSIQELERSLNNGDWEKKVWRDEQELLNYHVKIDKITPKEYFKHHSKINDEMTKIETKQLKLKFDLFDKYMKSVGMKNIQNFMDDLEMYPILVDKDKYKYYDNE